MFQVLLCIIKHQSFIYVQLNDKTILFQTIQFSKVDLEVIGTPQSSRITIASPSDCLLSDFWHSFMVVVVSYPSAGMQSVYSTAPANLAGKIWRK